MKITSEKILLALIISLPLTFLATFKVNQVVGVAMAPSYTEPMSIYSFRPIPLLNPLERGQVVIYTQHQDDLTFDVIQRIIALPGDEFSISEGNLYLNGQVAAEPYLSPDTLTEGGEFLEDDTSYTVPENSYLTLGDNRQNSADSREWGYVKRKDIISIVKGCYFYCIDSPQNSN